MKFKAKPVIVEARPVVGEDLWVVVNLDGTEARFTDAEFHARYERVSENMRTDSLVNQICPRCKSLVSRQYVKCVHCQMDLS